MGGAIDLILDSSHLDWNFFYFIVGWYLRRDEKMFSLCKKEEVLPICFIIMIVHVVYPKNLYVIFPIIAILFTLNISRQMANGNLKDMCVKFGKSTKNIYILHFFFMLKAPIIGLYFESIARMGIAPSIVTQFFIGMPVCLVVTYLCYKTGRVLNRNKYISRYCFGYL